MVNSVHVPVMVKEVIEALNVRPWARYIDCTLGCGGHAAAIIDHCSPGGQLLGIDTDPEAIKIAQINLVSYQDSIKFVNDNFVNLQAICRQYNFMVPPINGILFDLGLSSLQLGDSIRGFSFQKDGPLDMRFSPSQEMTAAEIVNTASETELARIIWTYGEEIHSRRIARQIILARPLETTLQLAKVVEHAVGSRRGRIHPATKTFQALRIAVNQELKNLELALKQAVNLLDFDGRLAVISYHSLEDRIVKQFLQRESKDCICPPETPTCVCGHKLRLTLINKKVITPSPDEIQSNLRSRSAKLRVAERCRDRRATKLADW